MQEAFPADMSCGDNRWLAQAKTIRHQILMTKSLVRDFQTWDRRYDQATAISTSALSQSFLAKD